jgi:hypothetical protein
VSHFYHHIIVSNFVLQLLLHSVLLLYCRFPAGRHKKRDSKEERLASVMAHCYVATLLCHTLHYNRCHTVTLSLSFRPAQEAQEQGGAPGQRDGTLFGCRVTVCHNSVVLLSCRPPLEAQEQGGASGQRDGTLLRINCVVSHFVLQSPLHCHTVAFLQAGRPAQ